MKHRIILQKTLSEAALVAACALPYEVLRLLSPASINTQRNYLRPPGALKDDNEFVATCIECCLCGEVCPPRCIRFHRRGGSGSVNTPFIDSVQKACSLCKKCMEICPHSSKPIWIKRNLQAITTQGRA